MSSKAEGLRLLNLRFVVEDMAKFSVDVGSDTTAHGMEHSKKTAGSLIFSPGPTDQVTVVFCYGISTVTLSGQD